jgi:hypothetical protein
MKIGGIEVKGKAKDCIVLRPGTDNEIVIWAEAVGDLDDFDAMCPPPKAPMQITARGKEPMEDEPGYLAQKEQYNAKRFAYFVITSLRPSEIEWESVKPDVPDTWVNYEKDLLNAGLSRVELKHIIQLVLNVNALDEAKLEEARKLFLRGRQQQGASFGRPVEQPSTQSGEPASD